MTLTDADRATMIKYRTEQAHEAVEDANFLIENNKLKADEQTR